VGGEKRAATKSQNMTTRGMVKLKKEDGNCQTERAAFHGNHFARLQDLERNRRGGTDAHEKIAGIPVNTREDRDTGKRGARYKIAFVWWVNEKKK